jgi:hypothetical protein
MKLKGYSQGPPAQTWGPPTQMAHAMASRVSPAPTLRMAAPTGCRASRAVACRGTGAGAGAGAGAVVGVGIGVRGGGMPAAICTAKFRPVAGTAGAAGALGAAEGSRRRGGQAPVRALLGDQEVLNPTSSSQSSHHTFV